jgi:hypothetical protein
LQKGQKDGGWGRGWGIMEYINKRNGKDYEEKEEHR